MAVTKTLLQMNPGRATFKIVGTAASDTATIAIKAVATPASIAAVTFVASTRTITRGAGSWITDFTSGTAIPVVGSVVVITITAGSTLNAKTFCARLTSATVLTVDVNAVTPIVDEGPVAISNVQWSGYYSDVAALGQTISTPAANITDIQYSIATTGDLTVLRNSVTALKLFGFGQIIDQSLSENNSFDIVATFNTTAGGTLILEVSKVDGFGLLPSQTVNGARPY